MIGGGDRALTWQEQRLIEQRQREERGSPESFARDLRRLAQQYEQDAAALREQADDARQAATVCWQWAEEVGRQAVSAP